MAAAAAPAISADVAALGTALRYCGAESSATLAAMPAATTLELVTENQQPWRLTTPRRHTQTPNTTTSTRTAPAVAVVAATATTSTAAVASEAGTIPQDALHAVED